jgi:hypothetical protein
MFGEVLLGARNTPPQLDYLFALRELDLSKLQSVYC